MTRADRPALPRHQANFVVADTMSFADREFTEIIAERLSRFLGRLCRRHENHLTHQPEESKPQDAPPA
jgi:hypothetical protein